MLLVGEISMSIVLLVATGLLLRSMRNLQNQPLGFRANHLAASWIGLPRIRYQNNSDVASFFTRVDERLRNSPGVEAVGLGYPLPLQGNHFWTSVTISGFGLRHPASMSKPHCVSWIPVSYRYWKFQFSTAEISPTRTTHMPKR